MLQLIWAFINVGAFLFFIITAFRAVKLVAEKHGLAATLILIIGFSGFMIGRNKNTVTNTKTIAHLPFTFVDRSLTKDQHFTRVKVKENWISRVEMTALIGKYKDNDSLVAIEANAGLYGFSGGYRWETQYVHIYPVQGTFQFRYTIIGTENWSLLGVTFYSVSREDEGVFFPVKSE
jgi:hypothetical protein